MHQHFKGMDFCAAQEWAALGGSRIAYTKDLEEVAMDTGVIYGSIRGAGRALALTTL